MGATVIGFAIGFALGAGTGFEAGAMVGGLLGALMGLTAHLGAWLWAHTGDTPVVERHRVLCTPFGQVADLELEGDVGRRRWTAVQRCSLLEPGAKITCDQRCLRRINDAGARPGRGCSCHESAAEHEAGAAQS